MFGSVPDIYAWWIVASPGDPSGSTYGSSLIVRVDSQEKDHHMHRNRPRQADAD